MAKMGKVFLVGAGPGDPKLITLQGVEALRQADVVLYDRLANVELLRHAPKSAERRYVGKDHGGDGDDRQRAIHAELIALAREGKTVVRLKGGDPYVFGRGGEEAIALAEAGVPFQVAPGISSAIAVPAYADIPVTHRGLSPAFAVFAGHTERTPMTDDLWRAAAAIPTAIFLMGVERLPLIVAKLLEFGRDPETPVALISRGAYPDQQVVEGALKDIVSKCGAATPPSTIVVGPVVQVRRQVRSLRARESVA